MGLKYTDTDTDTQVHRFGEPSDPGIQAEHPPSATHAMNIPASHVL